MSVDRFAYPLVPGLKYKPGQPLPLHQQRIQNIHAPKNSFLNNSSVDQGKSVLYELHSTLSCSQPLAIRHISVVSTAAYGHDRPEDAPQAHDIPFAEQVLETRLPDADAVGHKVPCDDIWVSRRRDTCNPIWCD